MLFVAFLLAVYVDNNNNVCVNKTSYKYIQMACNDNYSIVVNIIVKFFVST